MKKLLYIFILLWTVTLYKAQDISCAKYSEDNFVKNNNTGEILLSGACNKTSQYAKVPNLYLPKTTDSTITIRLNFIFLTKPDGTGNFEQYNPEHNVAINDAVLYANAKLANLVGTRQPGCLGYGESNPLSDSKIRMVVNKIWKVDPAWDYLQTGFVPCNLQFAPTTCTGFNKVDPSSSEYYYSYYDNDPTIPIGINVIFANNGIIYNDIINNHNYSDSGERWAASQGSSDNFTQKLRQFYPNQFNNYLIKMKYLEDHPDPTPWPPPYMAFLEDIAIGMLHETGHCFNLGHQNQCPGSIMKQSGNRTFMSNQEIAQIHFAASNTSVRQYFTDDSFKKNTINVTSNELWDLNFRLYSNVKIDNNSSLKATCKIIMAPQSRFIVKNGSNFIIEGAEITSANNSSWNGIKVEGNGYLLINPNTLINSNHFYAYADNTPLSSGRKGDDSANNINQDIITDNTLTGKGYKIYPNPTGDFINIETKNKVSKVEVYNLLNKSFNLKYSDNRLDVRDLSTGNYILKIYTSSEVKTINFIKK